MTRRSAATLKHSDCQLAQQVEKAGGWPDKFRFPEPGTDADVLNSPFASHELYGYAAPRQENTGATAQVKGRRAPEDISREDHRHDRSSHHPPDV